MPAQTPALPKRTITQDPPRDIDEHARDVARSLAGIEGVGQSRRERKKIEMRFAHLKRILKPGHCAVHEAPRTNLFWPEPPTARNRREYKGEWAL
jgi:hypothetical protein